MGHIIGFYKSFISFTIHKLHTKLHTKYDKP